MNIDEGWDIAELDSCLSSFVMKPIGALSDTDVPMMDVPPELPPLPPQMSDVHKINAMQEEIQALKRKLYASQECVSTLTQHGAYGKLINAQEQRMMDVMRRTTDTARMGEMSGIMRDMSEHMGNMSRIMGKGTVSQKEMEQLHQQMLETQKRFDMK